MEYSSRLLNDEKETSRVEAFSDGVFAIAITLLILNIKVPLPNSLLPNLSLRTALLEQWPSYLAFFISFATILIMWVNHHNIFSYIRRTNGTFLFLNGLILLSVIFVPFPTALLAEYIRSAYASTAASIYAATFVFNCSFFILLWEYASHKKRLLNKNIDPSVILTIRKNGLIGLPLYISAVMLAFFSVPASVAICFILAIFFAVTGSWKKVLAQK